ncbi:MAG: L,D-transpeptidase family protein [Desulfovibrionaceae bacterium]|nr:L,D-transpeptidase family protein [Desulfovibrionaceae bacterium]
MMRVWRLSRLAVFFGVLVFSSATWGQAGDNTPLPDGQSALSRGAAGTEVAPARHEAVRLNGLCLLASPDSGAATKRVLKAAEVVRVLATAGAWAEIEVRGGVRGYVLSGYLTGFSQDALVLYRDRLVQVARRPGPGDAVGTVVGLAEAAAPADPTTASPPAPMPAPGAEPAAISPTVAALPGPVAASPPVPAIPGDLAPSSSPSRETPGGGAMAPDAAAARGRAADWPVPDPQGGERLVSYVLDHLQKPAPRDFADRLTPAVQEQYDRKARYAIEVYLADCTLILYKKQADGIRHPARIYTVATPAGDVEAPAGWGVITQIEFEPWWRPTENMKRRARQKGRTLPDVMPPGVKNPMGPFKMHLSHGFAYRIHGNNDPKSIGRRVTNGCIRMRNDEGLELARILDVGTEVVFFEHAPPMVGQGAETSVSRP